jgi:hypothetical protein
MDVSLETEDRPRKSTRFDRLKKRIGSLHSEVGELETLAKTLLGHLEQAIRPGITDAERIRYRCMIQDIRETLENKEQQ